MVVVVKMVIVMTVMMMVMMISVMVMIMMVIVMIVQVRQTTLPYIYKQFEGKTVMRVVRKPELSYKLTYYLHI